MPRQSTVAASVLKPDQGFVASCCCIPVAQIYIHQGADRDCALNCCLSTCGLPATIHYACCYKPKTNFTSSGDVKREPDCLTKCCCPAPTVYYHEQNNINAKFWLACCFGWFYTIPCYHPTWSEQQDGGSESPNAKGQGIQEQLHEFARGVPKAEPEMQRLKETTALELV